jgi:hypothetical protein
MQPVKLVIPGQFWDTQIYAGRLYAFTEDGAVVTVNWDRLVEQFPIEDRLRVPFEWAFQHSNSLYLDSSMRDLDVRRLLVSKFGELAERKLVCDVDRLSEVVISRQDSPFPFPHSDTTIYKEHCYTVSQDGVFSASCNKKTKYGLSTKVKKHWDGSVFAVAASYDHLALAAGDDGLFEQGLDYSPGRREPRSIVSRPCTTCSWVFHSIYGASLDFGGFLADYNRERRATVHQNVQADESGRWLRGIVGADEIFHEKGYSWAAQDKICLSNNGKVKVAAYTPREDHRIKQLGEFELGEPRHGRILNGAVALFGTVIEYDDLMAVIESDESTWVTREEVVSWRVFPRSRHYENQLHVIFDDRLEILSFNNDYFVDQTSKLSGITFINYDRGFLASGRGGTNSGLVSVEENNTDLRRLPEPEE